MSNSLLYKLKNTKTPKILFYIKNYMLSFIPNVFYRKKIIRVLAKACKRKDYDYIISRVNYYNKVDYYWQVPEKDFFEENDKMIKFVGKIKDFKPSFVHKVYYFNSNEITRWFSRSLRWIYWSGNDNTTPNLPSIVNSRPLTSGNENLILLKLNKQQHNRFNNDKKSFQKKQNRVIFRGKIHQNNTREQFLKLYFDNPLFNCKIVEKDESYLEKWITSNKVIHNHLKNKFIITLEGNDTASNLEWIMSSNSVAVMPPPTRETWLMEGKLIPNYHYIAIRPNLSDLEDRILYYIEHPDEAERIIEHAHKFIKQFKNKKREKLIGLLVMQKYYLTSKQLP